MDIIPTNQIVDDVDISESTRRIIAEAAKTYGLRQFLPYGAGRKISYIDYLAQMLWDGVTEGIVTFADGTQLTISSEPKIWMDMVKFVAGHLDGPPNIGAQFNGINVFKVYQGIDPDRV
jgi:hypothetical protein